jgi:hypothetical protein
MITGRLHERLVLPDGSTFGKVFLHYIMDPFQKLRAYQFHQVSPTQVEVHVVSPIRDYLQVFRQEYQESLKRFHQVTEQQFQVTYKQVDLLEKTPSGKQLVIVNHVLPARQPMPVSAATEAAVPVFS